MAFAQSRGHVPLGFEHGPFAFQLRRGIFHSRQRIREPPRVVRQRGFGRYTDLIGQAQSARYGQSETLARHVVLQSVQRLQTVDVERHAGDAIAVVGKCILLDLTQMGGKQQSNVPFLEHVQQPGRERAALGRVGAPARFVEQDQRGYHTVRQQVVDIGDVGGEGR